MGNPHQLLASLGPMAGSSRGRLWGGGGLPPWGGGATGPGVGGWRCSSAAASKSLQSCPTLRDPMDCSLPGSSIHGIFQARVLEWGAIAFSEEAGILEFNSNPATHPLCGMRPTIHLSSHL